MHEFHMGPYEPRKSSVDPDLTSERIRNCYSVEALDLAVPYLMDHMGSKKATLNTPIHPFITEVHNS